jgi:hypothetical protein
MRVEKQAVWALWHKDNLTVLTADKGNVTIILNMENYTRKIVAILEDPLYKKMAKDPTQAIE